MRITPAGALPTRWRKPRPPRWNLCAALCLPPAPARTRAARYSEGHRRRAGWLHRAGLGLGLLCRARAPAKYALDESQIRPYFALNTVLQDGVFWAASQLFGIRFVERFDIPVYHPDVRVWEILTIPVRAWRCFTATSSPAIPSRAGLMGNFIEQSFELAARPVITTSATTKSRVTAASRFSRDDVITLFHEFGHTLHGLFASQRFATLSGTNTPRDFVEFRRKSMSTGPAILRCLATMPVITKPVTPCRTRCGKACSTRPISTRVMT